MRSNVENFKLHKIKNDRDLIGNKSDSKIVIINFFLSKPKKELKYKKLFYFNYRILKTL
jgi:hypothetical protein